MPEMPPFAVLKLKTGAKLSSDLDNENRPTLRSFLGSTGNKLDTVTIGRTEEVAHRVMHASSQKTGKISSAFEQAQSMFSVYKIHSEILGIQVLGYWSGQKGGQTSGQKSARITGDDVQVRVFSPGQKIGNALVPSKKRIAHTGMRAYIMESILAKVHLRAHLSDTEVFDYLINNLVSSEQSEGSAFDNDPELEAVEFIVLEHSEHGNLLASNFIDQSEEGVTALPSSDSSGLDAWLSQDAPAPANLAEMRLQARSRLRDEILHSVRLFSAKEVAKACGNSIENPRTFGQRLRKAGAIAVREANSYKFPAFQFQESGRLNPMMKEVLAAINSGRSEDEISDGWPALIWFYAPSGLLAGERPMDVFEREPDRVLQAAKLRFPKY